MQPFDGDNICNNKKINKTVGECGSLLASHPIAKEKQSQAAAVR